MKPQKCNVVPLFRYLPLSFDIEAIEAKKIGGVRWYFAENADHADVEKWVSLWLSRWLPCWRAFAVKQSVLYLGCWIGPLSRECLWVAPIAKWKSRATEIIAAAPPPLIAVTLYNRKALPCLCFVAQVAEFQVDGSIEKRLLTRLLRLPFTALTMGGIFSLVLWGGFSPKSAVCSTLAAAVRTSWTTITSAPRWDKALRDACDDASSIAPLVAKFNGMLAPAFWDNIAIARFLVKASSGNIGPKKFHARILIAISKAKAEIEKQRIDFPLRLPETQHILYKNLVSELYPDDLALTFKKRLLLFFPERTSEIQDIEWDRLRVALRSLPSSVTHQALRTLLHAWCTSARMHEPLQHVALCGCAGEIDAQKHYMRCPRIWEIVFSACQIAPTADSLVYLGIKPVSARALAILAAVSNAYHTVKADVLGVAALLSTSATTPLQERWVNALKAALLDISSRPMLPSDARFRVRRPVVNSWGLPQV